MTSINQQQDFSDNSFETLIIENLIRQAQNNKQDIDPKALLATLSKSLDELMEEIGSEGKSSKIVHGNFGSESASSNTDEAIPNSQVPSNATMEQAIAQLMGLLSQLEGEIAKWGNQKAHYDSEVGKDLMQEMQAQVKQAHKNLEKTLHEIKKEHFWSVFTKVAESIVGMTICIVACLCGQPELALVVGYMTFLAVSGEMDKATQALADVLQKGGMSEEAAKITAAAIIIVISIAVTMLTCGVGAAGTTETTINAAANIGEDVAESSAEIADTATTSAESNAESISEATEQSQSLSQRISNNLGKVIEKIKTNPFKMIPKWANLGMISGSMALGNTNFAQYLATIVMQHSRVKNDKEKEILKEVLVVVVDLLAALVGMGAGAAVAASPAMYQLNDISTLLKGLSVGQTFAGLTEAAGQFGTAETEYEMADITLISEDTQALLTMIRALISMNNGQSQADSKTLNSQLRAKAEGLASLAADVVKEGAAVAQALK